GRGRQRGPLPYVRRVRCRASGPQRGPEGTHGPCGGIPLCAQTKRGTRGKTGGRAPCRGRQGTRAWLAASPARHAAWAGATGPNHTAAGDTSHMSPYSREHAGRVKRNPRRLTVGNLPPKQNPMTEGRVRMNGERADIQLYDERAQAGDPPHVRFYSHWFDPEF